jgi:hypothetical protein
VSFVWPGSTDLSGVPAGVVLAVSVLSNAGALLIVSLTAEPGFAAAGNGVVVVH